MSRPSKENTNNTSDIQEKTIVLPTKEYDLVQECFSECFSEIVTIEKISGFYAKYNCRLKNDKSFNVIIISRNIKADYYIDIIVSGKTMERIIHKIELIHSSLNKTNICEKYTVIISYDSISEYYCNKILPKLNMLERNLRKLMFNIYTLNFGRKYFQATISEELQKKIKGVIQAKGSEEKKETKRLQEFFYFLEFADIQKILFTPKWTGIDEQERNKFLEKNNNLSELSDEKLRNAFLDFSPKSDWERFFSEKINISNIQEIIDKIRSYRNSIAHFKFFSRKDYDSCERLITELNLEIIKAIKISEEKDFANKNIEIISNSLLELSKKIAKSLTLIVEAQKQLFDNSMIDVISENISSFFSTFANIPKLELISDIDYSETEESEEQNNA